MYTKTVMVQCFLMKELAALLSHGSSASFIVDILARSRTNFDRHKVMYSAPNSEVTLTTIVREDKNSSLGQFRRQVKRNKYN